MAHQITIREDGKAEMAFTGSRANIWHGLGQELTEDSPIETWITEAGCDWNAMESPVFFRAGDERVNYPDKKVLYRSDTLKPLSIVGKDFKVVQPREVIEFFRDLVGDAGMKLSTAGTLFEGTRFWALAETGKFEVLNKIAPDEIRGHLLLVTAIDGTLATSASFVSTRVVCQNTLKIAMNEEGATATKQNHKTQWDPNSFKIDMGLLDSSWNKFLTDINTLCDITMTQDSVRKFFENEFYDHSKDVYEQTKQTEDQVNKLMQLYRSGAGADLGYGTAWGALNAVTNLFTHGAQGTRGRKKDPSRVFWDGYVTNDKIKQRVMSDLLEMA